MNKKHMENTGGKKIDDSVLIKRFKEKEREFVQEEIVSEVPNQKNYVAAKRVVGAKREGVSSDIPEEGVGAKILEKVTNISLLLLVFGLPLFFTRLSFQGLVFEKQMFFYVLVLLALVSWVARGVFTGELSIRKTPLDLPIALFVLFYGVATVFSIDKWHGFWGFFRDPSRGFVSVLMLAIIYYVLTSTSSVARIKKYVAAFVVSSFIVSVWELLVTLFLKTQDTSNAGMINKLVEKFLPTNIIGESPTSLGFFLCLSLPVSISAIFLVYHWATGKKMLRRMIAALLYIDILVKMVLICLVFQAIPVAALLIGLGVFFIFIIGKVIIPPRGTVWIPAVIFSAALVFTFTGGFSILGISSVNQNVPYSVYWDVMKRSTPHHFFLGSGPASYGYDFVKYKNADLNNSDLFGIIFYQSRGLLFESIATIGVIGFVLFVLLALSFVSVGVYMLSRYKENGYLSLGLFSASLIAVIAALTSQVEGIVLIFGTIVSALAMASLLEDHTVEKKEMKLSLKASPKYALSLAFLFIVVSAGVVYAFVFIGRMYAADLYAGKAARQKDVTEQGSIQMLSKAVLFSDQREGRYLTLLGQQYAYLANQETLKDQKDRNMDILNANLNNAILYATLGQQKMENDVTATEALAQVYEGASLYVADAAGKSEEYYQKALNLDPNSPVYLLKIGQIKFSQASLVKDEAQRKSLYEKAADYFQQSIDKSKRYSVAYYHLGIAKESLGDLDGAFSNLQTAFILENRTNVNYAFVIARVLTERNKGDDMKNAEEILKSIIVANDKDFNAHFSLGMIYEKTNRKNEAVAEYKKVVELIGDGSEDAKAKILKMIENIKSGIENTPQSIGLVSDQNMAPDTSQSGAPAADQQGQDMQPSGPENVGQ